MQVAIIGKGHVGSALAGALRRAGHSTVFGTRAPAAADEATISGAASRADAVILAIPFDAAPEVIEVGNGFPGRILIDASNPLGVGADGLGLTIGFDTSGAEKLAALAPKAHVFKTFNQTGFENMANASAYAARPVMFVAGDDEAGKAAVLQLVADTGFEAIDIGKLRAARLLEPFAMLWIELARKRGQGADFAFVLQRAGA